MFWPDKDDMIMIKYALIPIIFFMVIYPSLHAQDDDIRNRFISDYGSHAQTLQRRYNNIIAKYEFIYEMGDEKYQKMTVEAKFNEQCYLLDGQSVIVDHRNNRILSRGSRAIEGRNSQYTFTVKPTEDGRYTLTNIVLFDSEHHSPLCLLSVPYADPNRRMTFLEIAHDQETRCIEYGDRKWHNQLVKELKVKYPLIHPATKKLQSATVGYFFSPTNDWVCIGKRSYPPDGNHGKDSITTEEIYEYGEPTEFGLPALTRIEEWILETASPAERKPYLTTQISEFRSVSAIPETEFRLSVFGLPEPIGMPSPKHRPMYVWLLIAAALCAVLALGVHYFLRRRLRQRVS